MTQQPGSVSAVDELLASVASCTRDAEILPVAARLREKEAALQKAKHDILAAAVPGAFYPEEGGVFVGTYTPVNWRGEKLAPQLTFNIYAARRDVYDGTEGLFTYNEAVAVVAGLRGWRGFDGGNYANDTEITQALVDGTYDGGWIIPTEEMLCGRNGHSRGNDVRGHKNDDALKGGFTTERPRFADIDDCSTCYWSSSENSFGRDMVSGANFSHDDTTITTKKDGLKFRCRPVRLVPVPQ